ncbi:M20/M25/M40 family metallo-hydrolase [Nitrosococcus wardiae]|uniref:M20/M25/M40 family metallo-hydrolase n=2 Tax=Nitrosococcus wardiae TaxID=1814290 RepID=A0A4P7C0L3_9GAMM|nr:M20/M25/M40 family metallo-hydrolase [Nitrosococcus wardiae]
MRWQKILLFLTLGLIMLLLISGPVGAQIHHQLHITLDPETHRLTATDTITLPEDASSPVTFRLHSSLQPQTISPGVRLRQVRKTQFIEDYAVILPTGVRQFTLEYKGEIFHPITPISEEYARSFSASPGLIAPEGVFLAGPSYWYPHFGENMVTFSLATQLPPGWHSISQGSRTQQAKEDDSTEEVWTIDHPQEEIYLIAGPFTEYREQAGQVEAMAFLRQPDEALARKYLDATAQYIEMYRQLIGAYPYRKFALVENFWETGYGMPSFTLLGSRVIRFPFILRSSYPHEILHNWWGNGVYVDYDSGNWAEGLTSYLADHLLKEQQGQGVKYRRETLQKYTDYVQEEGDFPLTEFRSRHSAATQAVGYGKTLMLFHMLRQQLGDSAFIEALQRLYHQYRFQVASFSEVAEIFSEVSDQPLQPFFKQWVEGTGAPFLRIREARTEPLDEEYLLTATIEQLQPGKPYQLELPLAIYLEGTEKVYQTRLSMGEKTHGLKLRLPARPLRLEVDPQFDVFRRLHRSEIPPALSQAFGADRALAVLPSQAPRAVREGYAALARSWQRGRENLEITTDADLDELPTDRAVWLFGWENRFRSQLNEALTDYAYKAEANRLRLEESELHRKQHSAVVVARHRENPDHALAWVATDQMAAMPGLARKLPHYGKYSYLGFTGTEPENVVKGQWPVVNSPLSVLLVEDHPPIKAQLAPRKPLVELPPLFKAQRMMQDIAYLANPKMAGRGLGTPELDQAAQYIAHEFQAAGLKPGGNGGSYYQTWTTTVGEPERTVTLRNVVAILPGTRPELPQVVVGAHYDHLGRGWPDVHQGDEGKIHPGADDNASGIAVMLELARVLGPHWRPERTVVWVAFTAEEAGKLGSAHYLQHLGESPANATMAMLNLDTVGRLNSGELLVLAANSAREWVHIFRGIGFVTGVPIKTVPQDIGSSDHTSFLAAGIPAVQLFTGPHADFHRPTDTMDKINPEGLSKIAAVLKEAVEYLAFRPDPLHSQQLAKQEKERDQPSQSRRVVLGTVPDFSWAGTGVRLSGVTPDTPAETVGLQKNDIIIRLNDTAIHTLADFANVLRALKAGDSLTIEFLRDQQQQTVTAQVVAR